MNARYTPLIVGLLIGIALGLLFGWVIHPVERDVTAPISLQEKFQVDIVLMAAEAYSEEADLELTQLRLEALAYSDLTELVENALNYAQAHEFNDQDVQSIRNLLVSLAPSKTTSEGEQP